MLSRVFVKDEEHAKMYFKFEEWFKISKDMRGSIGEKESTLKELLKSSVSTFDDALKYYYSLGYDERMAWQKDFIGYAKTVNNLQKVLNLVDKKYRKDIVEKMQEIAVTDEEKRIAFSYMIWETTLILCAVAGRISSGFFQKKIFNFHLEIDF